jgi:hypothetical protein
MASAVIEHEPPDGSVRRPPIVPLLIGLLPFLGFCLWAVLGLGVETINTHPYWSFLVGAIYVFYWLRFFGTDLARGLDSLVRTCDFWLNRTYGPRLTGYPLLRKPWAFLKGGGLLKGYSLPIFFWTLLALVIVIFGPARSQLNDLQAVKANVSWEHARLCLIVLAILSSAFLLFSWGKPWLRGFTTVLLLAAIAGVVYWLLRGSPDFQSGQPVTEADHLIYPHVFLLFVGFACGLAYLARFLAYWLMSGFKKTYGQAWVDTETLGRVELFVSPEPPRFTLRHVLQSALATPLRKPHLLLFPIAVAVLAAPYAYITFAGLVAALFAWSVLALAGVHDRLSSVLDALTRNFFHGVLWGASALVIILAGCRFFDFSYVSTVINSTSIASLAGFLVSIYATLWYYKYWIGYSLCEQMLDILREGPNPAERGKAQLVYAINPGYTGTSVLPAGRLLQVHGTRFIAVGTFQHKGGRTGAAWESYHSVALFEAIVEKQPDHLLAVDSDPGGEPQVIPAGGPADQALTIAPGGSHVICMPAPTKSVQEKFGLSDLRQRVYFYYVLLDTLMVAALAFFLWGRTPPARAELEAEKQAHGIFKLDHDLFEPREGTAGGQAKRKAVILVAVSGGGTRAALYGAAVFRGLNDWGALDDVQLCSGVSGGSTAIAHFALHRANLVGTNTQAPAWTRYRNVMSAPFIDEVLCGTLEWRVAKGTRMGTFLDESFRRHLEREAPGGQGVNLADAKLGVIFNTTLTGTEPAKEAADPTNAGSRLIVTNLNLEEKTFPTMGFPGAGGEFLPYVVVQDPTARLTTGAALSANFPPVFSNAKVDLKVRDDVVETYWVTDGGVAENRGDISLLYVLLDALNREKAAAKPRVPRPVVIVIAEASGVSLDFTQDRGVGSMLGASGKFANQLMVELLEKIEKIYTKDLKGESFQVRYLPMPLVLRSRGGVGTHWMMPAFVTLANPRDQTQTMNITGEQASQLIMDLYVTEGKRAKDSGDEQLKQASEWIEGSGALPRFTEHRQAWIQLVETLKKLRYVESAP